MDRRIVIDGSDLGLMDTVQRKLVAAAKGLIEQNTVLILRDLGKTAADSDSGAGDLPVSVTFKLGSEGRRITIDAAIEWKRTKKCGDSLDLIVVDPDQKELELA